ncbi:MAG TPA: hypothetical protein VF538_17875 [Pyrinomonadaceae bacterium]
MSFNPATFNTSTDRPQPIPSMGAGGATAAETFEPGCARELAIWLSALQSFFDLSDHPLDGGDGERLTGQNFIHETRILQQVLRHCLHLCLSLSPETLAAPSIGGAPVGDAEFARELTEPARPSSSHYRTYESLSTLYGLCRALSQTTRVDAASWSGMGELFRREFDESGGASAAAPPPAEILRQRFPALRRLAESAVQQTSAGELTAVLSLLADALEHLSFVATLLAKDQPLKMALPIFLHVHGRAKEAVAALERMATRAAEGQVELYELFDGAGYAVGMELNKVFCRELAGLAAARRPAAIYTRVENAHGLLRDCFQQTILSLALAFDPNFEGSTLFDTLVSKLRQSLRLREEIWALSELVRRAERDCDRRPLAPLVARLRSFEEGAMRHLMYKDWESFERFVTEITAARGAGELAPVLHRFATYLDALFNQINMRAVLAAHPFDYPQIVD